MTLSGLLDALMDIPSMIKNGEPRRQSVNTNLINYKSQVEVLVLQAYLDSDPARPLILGQSRREEEARRYGLIIAHLYDPVKNIEVPVIATSTQDGFNAYAIEKGVDYALGHADIILPGIMEAIEQGDAQRIQEVKTSALGLQLQCRTKYEFKHLSRDIWEAKKVKLR